MKEDKKRWLSLFVLVLMPFMATLDANIINVALPTISKNLNITMADVEWVVTIYLIFISATIIIFGRLGDIKGKTFIFNIGIFIFTLGSLLCGVSHSLEFLVVARIVQAIGAACAMSTSQGIITQIFPPHERGRALGISGMAVALGTMTGAPVGGLIISALSWQYIFLINIPIGIITCILGVKILPKEKIDMEEKLDIKGAVLYFFTIISLLLTINAAHILKDKIFVVLGLIVAIGLGIIFIIVEKREEHPLLDITIFNNSLFSLSIFCSFLAFVAISSLNIIHPFYLQDILLLSVGTAGLFMMIFPIVSSIASPVSGYMSDKMSPEMLTFIGLMITSIGLFSLSTLKATSSLVMIGVLVGIAALGNSLFQSPNTSLVMSTVTKSKLGVAGSVNALVRNLGMTLGVLISTSVLYSSMSAQLGRKVFGYVQGEEEAFMSGMHWAYVVAGIICLIGAFFTGARLTKKKKEREHINI